MMSARVHLPFRPRQATSSKSALKGFNSCDDFPASASPSPEPGQRPPASHPKDGQVTEGKGRYRRRFRDSLQILARPFSRSHSRSPSEISSTPSVTAPEYSSPRPSVSSLASPISTCFESETGRSSFGSYANEIERALETWKPSPSSRSSSRVRRGGITPRRASSSAWTCSTFVNEEVFEDTADKCSGDARRAGKVFPVAGFPPVEEEAVQLDKFVNKVTTSDESDQVDRNDSDGSEEQGIHQEGVEASTEDSQQASFPAGLQTLTPLTYQDADVLCGFALKLLGANACDASLNTSDLHRFAQDFAQSIGHCLPLSSAVDYTKHPSGSSSSSAAASTNDVWSQGSSDGQGWKRKQEGFPGRDGDLNHSQNGPGDGDDPSPVKRSRPNPKDEENLRLGCPYRKRNPHKFNVRDHHSCAMTYFPKFAELRQHIVKQHKKADPSAFVCDRCTQEFTDRKSLRDHQRLPKDQMCELVDHDPEVGIDGPTSSKLLSRKRASGATPEVQWREIWMLLFPDDEDAQIQPYHFVPVIEHFELSTRYLQALSSLQTSSPRDLPPSAENLESLVAQFQVCFANVLDDCVQSAKGMPYVNRSNKRNEQPTPSLAPCHKQRASATSDSASSSTPQVPVKLRPRKPQQDEDMVDPRPDSGVVMDEDGDSFVECEANLVFQDASDIGPIQPGPPLLNLQPRGRQTAAHANMLTPKTTPTDGWSPVESNGLLDEGFLRQLQTLTSLHPQQCVADPGAAGTWGQGLGSLDAWEGMEIGLLRDQGATTAPMTLEMAQAPWSEAVYKTDYGVMEDEAFVPQ